MCAGYALYGSATLVALSTGAGLNFFMLDPVSDSVQFNVPTSPQRSSRIFQVFRKKKRVKSSLNYGFQPVRHLIPDSNFTHRERTCDQSTDHWEFAFGKAAFVIIGINEKVQCMFGSLLVAVMHQETFEKPDCCAVFKHNHERPPGLKRSL